jgi:hypothetical protein
MAGSLSRILRLLQEFGGRYLPQIAEHFLGPEVFFFALHGQLLARNPNDLDQFRFKRRSHPCKSPLRSAAAQLFDIYPLYASEDEVKFHKAGKGRGVGERRRCRPPA